MGLEQEGGSELRDILGLHPTDMKYHRGGESPWAQSHTDILVLLVWHSSSVSSADSCISTDNRACCSSVCPQGVVMDPTRRA